MTSPSICVKLVRPSALQLSAHEPCVLEIHIPVTIPHRLNPSLPAPPYHAGTVEPYGFRNHHGITVFRPLMAQILAHMLGLNSSSDPDYINAMSNLELEVATDSNDSFRLFATWKTDAVFDKANGFDFEAGYWKSRHGEEHRAIIHAFEDVWDRIIIYQGYVLWLICGVGEAAGWREVNPRVVRFDVVEEANQDWDGREIMFEAGEYTETARRRVNSEVAMDMTSWDSSGSCH